MDPNEAERQLAAAAQKSPELASMLLGKHDDLAPRYRRLAALVGILAAVGVAAWYGLSSHPRPKPFEPAEEIDRSVYLDPIKTQKVAVGEELSPFAGFAVSIETDPPGALVSIGGKVRGESPVLANVACASGDKVKVRADKAGFRTVQRDLGCRADTLVKLTLRLER